MNSKEPEKLSRNSRTGAANDTRVKIGMSLVREPIKSYSFIVNTENFNSWFTGTRIIKRRTESNGPTNAIAISLRARPEGTKYKEVVPR
ncbi:MAG: hypothetical protein M1515_01425 [Candidatus Thermoplasmatota archaeon]|nr:hypothetical protein [Candidatus Thermoplasmatota archaeon]